MTYEPESLIYTEVNDDFPDPTQEEIEEYAGRIGIDVKTESSLLYLAREGIQAKLPTSGVLAWTQPRTHFITSTKKPLKVNGSIQWIHYIVRK